MKSIRHPFGTPTRHPQPRVCQYLTPPLAQRLSRPAGDATTPLVQSGLAVGQGSKQLDHALISWGQLISDFEGRCHLDPLLGHGSLHVTYRSLQNRNCQATHKVRRTKAHVAIVLISSPVFPMSNQVSLLGTHYFAAYHIGRLICPVLNRH